MILKASQRAGGRKLGLHLLNDVENDHITVHEIRGFMSNNVLGAMNEAEAVSHGTKCDQYLFSLSLNPPSNENVRTQVFETAIERIEERLGLVGQPRMIVFHEKEGRRHAHAVWSRIKPEAMKAVHMSKFGEKLNDIAKELFVENGWHLPAGFIDKGRRNPTNFSLVEWQQAKRAGIDPRALKSAALEAWGVSKDAAGFHKELEARGFFAAAGEKRHVVLTPKGEVLALARMLNIRNKNIDLRLGDPSDKTLRSVAQTREHIAAIMTPRIRGYIDEVHRIADNRVQPLMRSKQKMKENHQQERQRLKDGQQERAQAEARDRVARLPTGFSGLWHRITGQYAKVRAQNEFEAYFSLQRDRDQRDALIQAQLVERQALQAQIRQVRHSTAHQVAALYREASQLNAPTAGRSESREASRDTGRSLGLERSFGPS